MGFVYCRDCYDRYWLLREAGKELWGILKNKLKPPAKPPPEPVQVDDRFRPIIYSEEDCRWVRHESLSRYEQNGYFYYPHPSNGGKVVRGYGREASYLMVNPNAKKEIHRYP